MPEALGRYAELRTITKIQSVPGSESRGNDPKKGVSIEMGALLTWDGRFGISDLEIGDIVKLENEGPCASVIAEVFREGLRIYPETPEKRQRILESVTFSRRLQTAISGTQS